MCCVWGGQVSNERRDNSVYLSATHWPPWPQETGWDEGFRAFVFTSAPGLANKILMVNIAWRQEIGKIGRAGPGPCWWVAGIMEIMNRILFCFGGVNNELSLQIVQQQAAGPRVF